MKASESSSADPRREPPGLRFKQKQHVRAVMYEVRWDVD